MERAELVELLSPEGLRLLDSLPPYESAADVVRTVSLLRKQGHPAGLVATVLTQSKLRAKAVAKFGPFASRMLFTEAGLEQATRLQVAARHAARYARAGLTRVADLGCGVGGDAMAMAALDLEVTAVEADEVTAAIASYNLAPFPNAGVVNAKAEDIDLAGMDAVYLDPARRTSGHGNTRRLADPSDWSPSLDFAFGLASTLPVGVKLGPGVDRELLPEDAETQWVSVDGQVVEAGVWTGALARDGIRRAALVVHGDSAHELTGSADADDEPAGDLGEFLYEPDGAVIRARLIGDLARGLGARMLRHDIAYLTADTHLATPFAAAFRVLDELPYKESDLRKALAQRGIGTLEIKKRGADVDPAALRKRLQLKGEASGTLVLTRIGSRHVALLVERLG
ncbi:class I SAM-dependent methyltransferase [Humibacter ginsenosidimutans]|uniref:Class I SAM-dependent methyltransferase n=1 Tax=Humibacter ginsenosidimutans TaxID=2599293 RepID=A0A5B8M2C8_9MICO|nr:class I SAM-dependent methyltransferase [Humibacter ginsenosidimutans]QDZ14928.1 class I SAM-dependent methyltransferase [Humibacter ginsenosidimutans]